MPECSCSNAPGQTANLRQHIRIHIKFLWSLKYVSHLLERREPFDFMRARSDMHGRLLLLNSEYQTIKMLLNGLQIYRKNSSNFSNKGVCVPKKFFPDVGCNKQPIRVTVHVHSKDWDTDVYLSGLATEISGQLQQNQAACDPSSSSSRSSTVLCTPSHPSKECLCKQLGPFKAEVAAAGLTDDHLKLTGIEHHGQLRAYRPEKPNHVVLVLIKVSCSLLLATHLAAYGACVVQH